MINWKLVKEESLFRNRKKQNFIQHIKYRFNKLFKFK
jgi:hypothetical protein